MAVKKEYSQNKKICKVTFSIPEEIAERFREIHLVGDFNNWDPKANCFTKTGKEGDYLLALELPSEAQYHFRYLADGITWFNEDEADREEENIFGSTNSVIIL